MNIRGHTPPNGAKPQMLSSDAVTGAQCRAARSLLGWSMEDLVARTELNHGTISRFETGKGTPRRSTIKIIRGVFEAAGIEILDAGTPSTALGPDVRLRQTQPPL